MHIPVRARSLEQMEKLATPAAFPGGNLEAYRASFYDTQTYATAGQASLDFFAERATDRTISNMRAAGQFPDPDFFQLWGLRVDILLDPSDAADPTAWEDVAALAWTGRSILELEISQKTYGPWLVSECQASGGLTGFGVAEAGTVGTSNILYGNNGVPGAPAGLNLDGSIIFVPKTSFGVRITWGTSPAVAADTPIRVVMQGVIYRRIL